MNPEPKAPSASVGPTIDLETEPLVFFHPTLAGTASAGAVQPLPGALRLEEEPATWPQFGP